MRCNKLIVSILILAVVIVLSLVNAFSPSITGYSVYINKIDSEVLEDINEEGEADVIVILKEENEFKKNDLEDSLDENDFKKKRDLVNGKGFSGKVNNKALAKLAKSSDVLKVEYNHKMRAFLQDTRSLINSSLVNSLLFNGVNLTGVSKTICILDTGINYSHPDLGNCSRTSDIGVANCGKVIGGYDYVNSDNDPYDDNGHGTHVAGIAVANGEILGVAPEANIVSVKVLDSAGNGASDDIVNGIQWCVDNSTKYNISVISMSLGSDSLYSGYCDDSFASFVSAINDAYNKNISVFAATGNSGSTTQIASPACIVNATSVSATDKSDSIASYSNRNNITELLAPGGESTSAATKINSTSISGGYSGSQGTSMAVPHASGVALLMVQYKNLESNLSLRVDEVKNNLSLGKVVGSWARVDAREAIIGIDARNPSLVLEHPENVTYSFGNISLNYSASDINLDKVWYNLDDGVNITLNGNSTINVSEASYSLNLYANDSKGNLNSSSVTFNMDLDNPEVSLDSPVSGFNTSLVNLTFNCSAADFNNLSNISLYHNISGSFSLNQSVNISGSSNSSSFSVTNILDGNYVWNCLGYDNDSSYYWDSNRSFRIDTASPVVSLSSPGNNNVLSSSGVSFGYSVSDLSVANCSLILDGSVDQTSTSIGSFSKTLSNGNYMWNVSCTDYVNLVGRSESWSFNVSVASDSGSSGGSGGGGGGSGGGGSVSGSSFVCNENWKCGEWSDCVNGLRERSCNDLNGCGSSKNKPDVIQECEAVEEKPIVVRRSYNKVIERDEISNLLSSNENLIRGLEIISGRVSYNKIIEDTPGVVNSLDVSRELTILKNESEVKLSFNYNGSEMVDRLLVYDEIPKEFAESASEIIIDTDAEITIVEEDPVFMFLFSGIQSGDIGGVGYRIDRAVNETLIDQFGHAVFLVESEESSNLGVLVIVFSVVFLCVILFSFRSWKRLFIHPKNKK